MGGRKEYDRSGVGAVGCRAMTNFGQARKHACRTHPPPPSASATFLFHHPGAKAPDATKDRVCFPCEVQQKTGEKAGSWLVHYFDGTKAVGKQCQAVTTCKDTEEETKAPTVTSNRECRACDFPKQFLDAGTRKCKATQVCGAEEHVTKDATRTSDRVCKANAECTSAQYEATPAKPGEKDRVCATCSACPANHHETAACAAKTDTQCAGCISCDRKEWLEEPCGATTQAICTKCTRCRPSEYAAEACSERQDTVCEEHTECDADEFVLIEGEPVSGVPGFMYRPSFDELLPCKVFLSPWEMLRLRLW